MALNGPHYPFAMPLPPRRPDWPLRFTVLIGLGLVARTAWALF